MDWHSLAMKSTELRRAVGSGEAAASSERIEDRMWRTQAMQPLRKASSTAGESVKRLKEEADGLSVTPDMIVAETESEPAEYSVKSEHWSSFSMSY